VGTVVLVVAALAAGRAVSTAFPLDGRLDAPFVRTGEVGDVVDLRYARVTAGEPDGSTLAEVSGTLMATPGVWVSVPVTIVAEGEPRRLGYAAVVGSDGRTYRANGMRSQTAWYSAQPGIPHYGSVLVELPAEAAVGAHLQLSLEPWDQRSDDMADIDLGITAEDVERWTSAADPVAVPAPSDVPPEA
jgi:hypothetical protein